MNIFDIAEQFDATVTIEPCELASGKKYAKVIFTVPTTMGTELIKLMNAISTLFEIGTDNILVDAKQYSINLVVEYQFGRC